MRKTQDIEDAETLSDIESLQRKLERFKTEDVPPKEVFLCNNLDSMR